MNFSLVLAVLSPVDGETATTTRYWDCSGGSCGCGYGNKDAPIHCPTNALKKAPDGNEYDAKYYGGAAVSAALGGGDWMSEACGKCFKLTYNKDTIVVKATNFCPDSNTVCAGDKKHFDIAAPGFDNPSTSDHNTCGWYLQQPCSDWSEGKDCKCDEVMEGPLREGCKNFLALGWDNPTVEYEAVDCPPELDIPCWEDNKESWPEEAPAKCKGESARILGMDAFDIQDRVYV